jgi:hypothetical protein
MTKFVVMLPMPAGSADPARAFGDEISKRLDEFSESRRQLGVTRETWWIQGTPAGDLFVLLLEGEDPIAANIAFAASSSPFDVWFKDTAGSILGADFNQPIPVQPEPIYRSAPDGPAGAQSIAVAVPLLPGKTEAQRALAAAIRGERREAFDEFHRRAGVTEDWWIEETPMGDFLLLYLESDDLGAAIGHLARSQDETEVWFKRSLLETQGIDWGGPPPPLPDLGFDWRA